MVAKLRRHPSNPCKSSTGGGKLIDDSSSPADPYSVYSRSTAAVLEAAASAAIAELVLVLLLIAVADTADACIDRILILSGDRIILDNVFVAVGAAAVE